MGIGLECLFEGEKIMQSVTLLAKTALTLALLLSEKDWDEGKSVADRITVLGTRRR